MNRADFERKYCRCDAMRGVTCSIHADLAETLKSSAVASPNEIEDALWALHSYESNRDDAGRCYSEADITRMVQAVRSLPSSIAAFAELEDELRVVGQGRSGGAMINNPQAALRSAAAALTSAADMLEHNDAIFKGKWKKGSKAWSGDFIERTVSDGLALIGASRTPRSAIAESAPIDMLMFCPRCQMQHVDAPEPEKGWTNPPHATHTCKGCGLNWRPSNALTNGVAGLSSQEAKHVERFVATDPRIHSAREESGK